MLDIDIDMDSKRLRCQLSNIGKKFESDIWHNIILCPPQSNIGDSGIMPSPISFVMDTDKYPLMLLGQDR